MRKVHLFIACSLDGYITDPDGGLSFLSSVEKPGEDYGYADFIRTVDTVIMGRKTYDKVRSFGIEFPHKDKTCYVWSRSKTGKDDDVTFFNGPVSALVKMIRTTQGANIFCDGGAELVHALLEDRLIDLFTISFIPVILGGGTRLFKEGFPPQNLVLIDTRPFDSGLVQLHYARKDQ